MSLAAEQLEQLRLSHCKKLEGEALTYIQKIGGYLSLKKVYLNECRIDREELESFEAKNEKIQLIF